MRYIYLVLLLITSLYSAEFGSLSLVVLKDGKALANQNFEIINLNTKKKLNAATDEDGYFFSKLEAGKYQVLLISRDNGEAQAFVRKNVAVKANLESQVIVSLKNNNSLSFIDLEAPRIAFKQESNVTKVLQKGSLLLTLLSSEDKKKVANATIFVKGSNIEAKTDKNGFVELTLPEGEQTLTVIHQDFSAQTVKVKVLAKETISKQIELSPAAMELEEFVVLAPHIEGSVAAVIAEQRKSDAVGNVLGSEQFSKSGDSSVASALKRVSGITIVGGKYVYVRGLGDRYSTVMLNGLHVPSPEPTKRVVPLDIFPTSVVQSITIQKSYTGDIPASFGGGTVLIKSKDIPKDSGYVKVGAELLVNSATGKKATINDDNSLGLPAAILEQGSDAGGIEITKNAINYRKLNHKEATLAPGIKLELSAGNSFELSKNFTAGASATLFYKNTSDSDTMIYDKYFFDINSKKIYHDNHTDAIVTKLKTTTGGMLNIGMDYYENNKVKYTFFTTTKSTDSTTLASIDYTGDTEDREKTYYEYVQKKLTTHQLSGKNEILFNGTATDGYFDNLVVEWAGESATATRDEPGTIEINYQHQTSGLNWDRKNWYYYFMLDDKVSNYRADFSLPFTFNDNDNYTKAGVFIYSKERDFDSRRFKMLSMNFDDMPQKIDTIYSTYSDDLDFSASYRDSDSYSASQDVTAFYLKQMLSVTHDFDVIASVRQEKSSQQLTDAEASHPPLDTSDIFPSLGLTYRFDNDDMQLRFAYANTISRPDFREFSNSRYKDPITENIVFGNPQLKATYITHLDLKYEWYMSSDEVFSVAVFSKDFKNPIEKVIKLDDSQDNIFQETYQNAKSATSYGFEVDYRKKFGFIDERLENILFATNISVIQSNIVLNDDPNNEYTSRLTSKDRPMQGQSPYVANFTLGYDNADTGNSALFLFNQIGKRIVSLGTDYNEDIYEQPFAKLDFVLKYKISAKEDGDLFGYALRFKAENLLDSEVEFTQGDNTTASTKPGRYYSLKLDIKY